MTVADRHVARILRDAARTAYTGVDPRNPVVCLECDDSLFPDHGYTAVVDGRRGFVCRDCNSKDYDGRRPHDLDGRSAGAARRER